MAANHTSSYSLNQWVKSDRVLMEDFNEDNRKIDAALSGLNTGLAAKASSSALNTLKATVNGLSASKADQSDLDALKTTVDGKASTSALNGLKSMVASLQTAVDKKQDSASAVRIVSGSYTGRGRRGEGYETSLSFASTLGKLPELLIIRAMSGEGNGLILLKNMTYSMMNLSGSIGSGAMVEITWNASSKTVSWFGSNSEAQFDKAGTQYLYFAIG